MGAPIEVVLHEAANRIVRFFLSDFGRQVFRICVSESFRFPELGRRFYESGPKLVRERMTKVLTPYVERGVLKIDDMDLAANQFGELCKADLFVRNLCGVCNDFNEQDVERVVNGAVEMFLARYRA